MAKDPYAVLRALRSLVDDRLLSLDDALKVLDLCGIPRSEWSQPRAPHFPRPAGEDDAS